MILGFLIHEMVQEDRLLFLEHRAFEAQSAANRADWKQSFAIVRALAGKSGSPIAPPVRQTDGSLTSSEDQRQARWQEHFQNVFNGKLKTPAEIEATAREPPLEGGPRLGPADVRRVWRKLGRNKGTGRDGLPAEVLVAAGAVLEAPAAMVYNSLTEHEDWPVAWTGGRMQEIHKKKGPTDECDEYRGIVLEDHLAKGYKLWLNEGVKSHDEAGMPDSQHGAVPGRSTDFANHLVREYLC